MVKYDSVADESVLFGILFTIIIHYFEISSRALQNLKNMLHVSAQKCRILILMPSRNAIYVWIDKKNFVVSI
jgi:hypothetical protein